MNENKKEKKNCYNFFLTAIPSSPLNSFQNSNCKNIKDNKKITPPPPPQKKKRFNPHTPLT